MGREGEPLPLEVRHVVPAELYRHYYHLLRITGKGLRYLLEFFEEVLGENVKPLITAMKALQDHLGDLQDAVVASTLLSDFLRKGHWGKDKKGESAPIQLAPGVAAYLAARQTELRSLIEGFPPVWEQVRGQAFGERLGALAAALTHAGQVVQPGP